MASEIAEHVPAAGVFMTASSNSEWYEHLKPKGSCLRLLYLLAKERELIHQLGPKGITVLHKGVQHGCVRLVKFILVNLFDSVQGSCTCRVHGPGDSRLTREQLLRKACEEDVTAVHMAVVSGSPKMVLLLKWAIDKSQLELEKKNSSSKGDEVTPSDATRVRLQRVQQHRSARDALLSFKKGWEMEGEDMRRLFEAGNIEDSNPSALTSTEPCLPAAEEEIMEDAESDSIYGTESNDLEDAESESIYDTESYDLVAPDVKDHTIDCVYDTESKESVMIPKVYDLIERILKDCFGPRMQEKIQKWRDECKKDVDFEFVPVAHVFLHFLISTGTTDEILDGFRLRRRGRLFFSIVSACKEQDLKDQGNPQGNGSMVATLFKILDPRGRTVLHAAFDHDRHQITFAIVSWVMKLSPDAMSTELVKECLNCKDGAGRTILHFMCIHDEYSHFAEGMDFDVALSPLCCEELDALKRWCFPHYDIHWSYTPVYLAILFDSRSVFDNIYSSSKYRSDYFETSKVIYFTEASRMALNSINHFSHLGRLQLAAFLGRTKIIEEILLTQQAKTNSTSDHGLSTKPSELPVLPAIHCAALSGQVEAIQSILKFPIYDPIIQHESIFSVFSEGTALHLLLKRKNFNKYVNILQTLAALHVLPNSASYARLKHEFSKLHFDEHEPKMFSVNEISCINLLLQAGIDIWTPHCKTGEPPSPGPMANDKAREWWYNKVVNEVVIQKTSVNNAANATSVIATLVATASFIGPLQPPLGLADDGFLHTSRIAVRVYLVCNGLSFYFSIASILMAVLPAIPMPKESLYDELFRSQRCLKTAALLLLVSIMCILTSFTSASIAVVSSERHDKLLVGAYIVVGGAVCVMVLVVYIIRLLRMVFYKNDRFRRWFAKNMIF